MNENSSKRDTMYRKKHAGVPGNGGQTAAIAKGTSGRSLVINPNEHKLDDRAEQLLAGGYVTHDFLSDVGDVRDTAHRENWWDRARVTAGYDTSAAVPQMPDDNTPNQTTGNSLSSLRRTHRMSYEGQNGFAIRMPSHTAMHRYADQLHNEGKTATFDIPVQAVGPNGHTIQGWVRATRLGKDAWSTSSMGIPGTPGDMIAEAVCALGEARRGEVRASVAKAGDLIEKAVLRDQEKGVTLQEVQSTWISGMAYDTAKAQMHVEMNGKDYVYDGVSAFEAGAMINARSAGGVFHEVIGRGVKQKKAGAGVATRCNDCKRFTSPTATHMCAAGQHASPSPENVERNEKQRLAAQRALASDARRRSLEGQRTGGPQGKA
jgi:hypothetical protein